MSTATTGEQVLCRDLSGALHRVRLTDRGEFASPGSMLHQRLVTGPNDAPFLRKSVPVDAGRRHPRLYDLLDNEIRVTAHLSRTLGAEHGEIPLLAGYNMDAGEPFVLLRPYTGQPAAEAVRGFDQERRRQFQIGLLRALHLIGAAGVVHGALGLDSLRWNGAVVQLVDFEQAQRTGEARRAGAGPRLSPEKLRGGGPADPRDDVWSAGVLIRELVIGPQAIQAPADQSADPERLRERLGGVFRPVTERPDAAELLRRMRATPPAPRPSDPQHGLAEGQRLFEEASRRKGGAAPPGALPALRPPQARRGWRQRLFSGEGR